MDLKKILKLDLFENLDYLLNIYEYWEKSFSALKNYFNIDCPSFCSNCCDINVDNIQTTLFEMLPAALLFFKIIFEKPILENSNSTEKPIKDIYSTSILNSLFENTDIISNLKQLIFQDKYFSRCVFYNKKRESWGCSIYHFRPAICRLFAYSLKRNKDHSLVFSYCKELKKQGYKKIHFENENLITKKLKFEIPIYDKFYLQVLNLNYLYTKELYNINIAFKKAFELVYLKFYFNNKKTS